MSDVVKAVGEVLASLTNEVAAVLADPAQAHIRVQDRITVALAPEYGWENAYQIAFHLSDWMDSAAFLLALHANPERFSDEEIAREADSILIHAPNHLAAAASLAGKGIQDVWELGLKIDTDDP